jgi:predicted permease
MRFFNRIQLWIRATLQRSRMESEMDAELRFHIEAYAEDLIRGGVAREEAMRRARIEFGGIEGVKEEGREARGVNVMDICFHDIQYGLRMLQKNPWFTALAVLTLALGIGVNTSVFSLLNFVLLRPLSVPDAESVTVLSRGGDPLFSYLDYCDYRDRNQSFTALAATTPTESSLDYQGESRATAAEAVSGNYSEVMKIEPLLGRWFTNENENAAVISYDAWKRLFGADPEVLGKHVRSESQWYTVIGVAPPDFTGIYAPIRTDIWVPFRVWINLNVNPAAERNDRVRPRVMLFGRLKAGIEPSQAAANLDAIDQQILKENGGLPAAKRILVERVHGAPNPAARQGSVPAFVLLFIVVGFVLLIACINVGNLLLAQGVSRQQELSVRAALGAGRSRLLLHLLTETSLLCLLGAAAGLLVGYWTNRVLEALLLSLPITAPIQLNMSFDHRLFAFAGGLAVLTALVCGLFPAWSATGIDIAPILKGAAPSAKRFRLRHASLVAQVALSLMLLLCAGLFLRSMARMQSSDPGFAVKNRLYALAYISEPEFNAGTGRQFYAKALESLRDLPGVRGASLTRLLPLRGEGSESDCVSAGNVTAMRSTYGVIDSGFLTTMQIPLLEGREFSSRDLSGGPRVAIVNETLARILWPQRSAIGQVLRVGCKSRAESEVVGVARDSKVVSLGQPAGAHFYLPYSQNYTGLVTIVVETAGDPGSMVRTVRETLHKENESLRIYGIESLASHIERSYYQVRWESFMLLIFGLVALLLAAVGLYGVIAYHVTQRTREIGLRIALGAHRGDINRLILWQGVRLTGVGVLIGLGMSLAVTRLLARFLSGLSPTDPVTFGATAILWLCVGLAACWIPARRAMRVDPMTALRYE